MNEPSKEGSPIELEIESIYGKTEILSKKLSRVMESIKNDEAKVCEGGILGSLQSINSNLGSIISRLQL